MTHYSIQPRDRIFVKGYGFLSFVRNTGRNLVNKYSQKLLDHATDAFELSQKDQFKTAEATSDLIGNKIVDKITSPQKLHDKIIQTQRN